jgi:murein DD-endopeptidase MepM/ murein hydrolase activator NlpD
MGANPAPNQNVEEYDVPADKRVSTEELAKQDAEFVDAPVQANEQKGELAIDTGRDYKSLAVRIDRSIKDSQLREQSVLDLWESLSERQSLLNSTPNIKPAKGWFTSKFGYRLSPFTGKTAFHNGLDIAAAPGSPVYAPADGIVTYAGYDQGYGKLVSIDHGYGVMTRFGHNSQLYVQVGQKVSRWDVIAAVGNTGRSTGAHLHYEVRVNGIARDPAIYILDE